MGYRRKAGSEAETVEECPNSCLVLQVLFSPLLHTPEHLPGGAISPKWAGSFFIKEQSRKCPTDWFPGQFDGGIFSTQEPLPFDFSFCQVDKTKQNKNKKANEDVVESQGISFGVCLAIPRHTLSVKNVSQSFSFSFGSFSSVHFPTGIHSSKLCPPSSRCA